MITDTISRDEYKHFPLATNKVELRVDYGLKKAGNLASFRRRYLEDYLLTDNAIEEDKKIDAQSIHVLYQINNHTIGGIRFTDLRLKSCPIRNLGILGEFNINSSICEAGRFFLKPEFRSNSLKLLRMTSQLMSEVGEYEYYMAICHDQFVPLYNRLITINLANTLSLPHRDKNYNLILGKS